MVTRNNSRYSKNELEHAYFVMYIVQLIWMKKLNLHQQQMDYVRKYKLMYWNMKENIT